MSHLFFFDNSEDRLSEPVWPNHSQASVSEPSGQYRSLRLLKLSVSQGNQSAYGRAFDSEVDFGFGVFLTPS